MANVSPRAMVPSRFISIMYLLIYDRLFVCMSGCICVSFMFISLYKFLHQSVSLV